MKNLKFGRLSSIFLFPVFRLSELRCWSHFSNFLFVEFWIEKWKIQKYKIGKFLFLLCVGLSERAAPDSSYVWLAGGATRPTWLSLHLIDWQGCYLAVHSSIHPQQSYTAHIWNSSQNKDGAGYDSVAVERRFNPERGQRHLCFERSFRLWQIKNPLSVKTMQYLIINN